MKKNLSLVSILMFAAAYALPARADTGGARPNSPASNQDVPAAGVAQTDRNDAPKLVVEFQSSRTEIPASFTENLNTFGKYLKDNPAALAEIHGYADHTGHGPANAALATKRAQAVKEYLVNHYALAPARITAEGYGEVSTKTRNDTDASKQSNRSAIGSIIQPKS